MSVVQNFCQMESAVNRNETEVLVIGKLAEQIKFAFCKTEKMSQKAEKVQRFFLKRLARYTIVFRDESCYVPVILSRKTSNDLV